MFPSGRAFGFPRPPRPPPSPTVEPCQSPPFQDCWDGNVCQLDNQCGKNGRCKILMHDSCRPTGYVHIQKFKAHFQSCSLDKKGNVNCLLSRKTIQFSYSMTRLKNDLNLIQYFLHSTWTVKFALVQICTSKLYKTPYSSLSEFVIAKSLTWTAPNVSDIDIITTECLIRVVSSLIHFFVIVNFEIRKNQDKTLTIEELSQLMFALRVVRKMSSLLHKNTNQGCTWSKNAKKFKLNL